MPLSIAPMFISEIGRQSYEYLGYFAYFLGVVVGLVMQKLAAKKPQKIGDRSRAPTH